MDEALFKCPEHSHKCGDPNCPDAFTLAEVLFHWRRDTERLIDSWGPGPAFSSVGKHVERMSPEFTLTLINTLATLLDTADHQYGFGHQFVVGVERIVIAAGFEKVR